MLRGHEPSRRILVDNVIAAAEIRRRSNAETTQEPNPNSLRGNRDDGVSMSQAEIPRNRRAIEEKNSDEGWSTGGEKSTRLVESNRADNAVSIAKGGIRETPTNERDGESISEESTAADESVPSASSPVKQSTEINQDEGNDEAISSPVETAHHVSEQPNLESNTENNHETADAAPATSMKKVNDSAAWKATDEDDAVTAESSDTETTAKGDPASEFENDEAMEMESTTVLQENLADDSTLTKDFSPSTAKKDDSVRTKGTNDEKTVAADSLLDKITSPSASFERKDQDETENESTYKEEATTVESASKLDQVDPPSGVSKSEEQDDNVTESTADGSEKNVEDESEPAEDVTTSTVTKLKDDDDEITESIVADSTKNVEADPKLDEDANTFMVSERKEEEDEVTQSIVADSTKNVEAASTLDEDANTSTVSKVNDEDDEVTQSIVAGSEKNLNNDSTLDQVVTASAASKVKEEDNEVTQSTHKDDEKTGQGVSTLEEDATDSSTFSAKDKNDEKTVKEAALRPDEDAMPPTASTLKDQDVEVAKSSDNDDQTTGKAVSTLAEDAADSTTSRTKDEDDEVTESTEDKDEIVQAVSAPDKDSSTFTTSRTKDEDDEVTESTEDKDEIVQAVSTLHKDAATTLASKTKVEDDETAESTNKDVAKTVTAASTLEEGTAITLASKSRDEDDEVTENTAADNANTFLTDSAKEGTILPTASKTKGEEAADEVTQATDNKKTIEAEFMSHNDDTTSTPSETKVEDDEVIEAKDVDAAVEADSARDKNATLSTASNAKHDDNAVTEPFDGDGTAKDATMGDADDKLATESNHDASLKPHLSDGGEFEKSAVANDNDEVANRTNEDEIVNKEASPSAESELINEDAQVRAGTDDDDETVSVEKGSNAEQVSIPNDEVTGPNDGETVGSGSGHQDQVTAIDDIAPFTSFNASVADVSNSTAVFSFENLECKDQDDYLYNGRADARRWMRILSSEPVDEDHGMESYKPAERLDEISSGGQSNFSTASSAIEDLKEPVMDCSYVAKHLEICSEVVHLQLHEGTFSTVTGSLASVVEDDIVKVAKSADDATGGVDNSTNLATIAEPTSKPESLSSAPRTYDEDDDDDDDDDAGENSQVRRTESTAEESGMDAAAVKVSSEEKGKSQELNGLNYTSSAGDNVVASASAIPSDESGSENKFVITIGSLYCPVSCNAVKQCEVARDHFTSLSHGQFADAITEEGSTVTDSTETSAEGGGSTSSADLSPKEGSFPKDIDGATVENEEVSLGVDETASNDEEIPLCSDDPTFLYKGYSGYNCAYIKENKPEKCLKEHNGQLIGVVSCPVSCEMIDKCKALYSVEDQVVGKAASAPGKTTEEDEAAEAPGQEKELSTASSPSNIESSITTPNDLGNIRSNGLTGVCEDDPTFLYKNYEGYDCHYIKENKPEKCLKERNGQLIGVVSCPVSCGMVEQCHDALEKSVGNANMSDADVDGKEGSQDGMAEAIDYNNDEGIKGKVDNESTEEADVANIKDMNSEVSETEGTVSSGGEQSSATGLLSMATDQASSTLNKGFESAADDGKRPASASSCKDDPTFRYKDKDVYTCQFIGSYKTDKCKKEHNGLMIGIYFCPESCGMVDKCLQASEISTAGAAPIHDPCKDLSTFRLNGEPDKDCLWLSQHEKCELVHDETGRMIGKYFCPESCGLLEASCFVGDSGDASLSNDGGADPESPLEGNKTTYEYNSNEEGIRGRSDDGYGMQSSSESEEAKAYGKIDQDLNSSVEQGGKLDEKWEVLEQEVQEEFGGDQQELENETNKESESSSALWTESRIGDDVQETSNMDSTLGHYGNSFNSENIYGDDDGYAYGGSGFRGNGDENYGGVNGFGYEDESSWNKNGETGSFTEENSDWNKNGYEYREPSNASWNSGGQVPGQIEESENWNNPGNTINMPSETWDDEDDGFPVGMLLLFFVLLAVFLYLKKSRTANSSQGRYQRVEVIDRNMYVNKRR